MTKALCVAVLAASLVFGLTERKLGFGASDLIFTVPDVLAGQLWRIFTYAFVESSPFGLILTVLFLYLFGGFFEYQWGSRPYGRFFALSSVGAALVAVPLSLLIDLALPFQDIGMASGPGPALDALLVSLAVSAPNQNVMFGFVLPVRVRTLVLFLLGYQLIAGIMQGASSLSVTLGGMFMGYVLTTGIWRPERLMATAKLWRLRKRRRGLYVVPPRGRDHTLH